jgi:hypothetical protein
MGNDITKSAQVPGQFLGYALQITECLRQLLIASPGTTVSIEVFEDVGAQSSDGNQIAIQTKSSLTANPIADRSVELWKAFANWIRAVKANQLPLDRTNFQIHVFSPKSGVLANTFHAASTNEAAIAALVAARNELWGATPQFLKRSKVAATLRPHLDVVFTTNDALVVGIIKRFTLTFGSGTSRADLEQHLLTKWAPEGMVDHVLDKCLGWVKAKVEAALERLSRAAVFRGNGAGSAAHYFVGTGAWGTG